MKKNRLDIGPHHHASIRFWACTVALAYERKEVKLKKYSFEHEFQSAPAYDAAPYRPDAVFEMESDGLNIGCAVEIDCATESPSFVASKVRFFGQYLDRASIAGILPHAMLFAVPSVKRVRSLIRAFRELPRLPIFATVFTGKSQTLSFRVGWYELTGLMDESFDACDLLERVRVRMTKAPSQSEGEV